ncbi:MAG: anthranilate synthase component I family protein [Pseudomonadota bacterium]
MFQRAVFGEGFAGALSELSAPRAFWAVAFDELRTSRLFDVLAEAEAGLSDGEVLAGYLSYECALAVEPQLPLPEPPLGLPAACFAVFTEQSLIPEGPFDPAKSPAPNAIDLGQSRAAYAAQVVDIQSRISAGDVFQVNLSHRQRATFPQQTDRLIESLSKEQALRAPFGAWLDFGTFSVLSASPEQFLTLVGATISSEPIKGTRPRSDDPVRDQALLEDLEGDQKDRAENIMIVDLMRNDFAKVCDDGSVTEPVICASRSYPSVHHLYSRIEGRLRDKASFADALKATFPCGSITGAPKLAAMEAIAELEGEGRGPYCGTVFWRTHQRGAASVAIRTAVIDEAQRRVDARSGGGVTILSDPEAEFEETLDKAYLFRALTGHDDPDRR